jgi:hypothetical protein
MQLNIHLSRWCKYVYGGPDGARKYYANVTLGFMS